MCLHVCGGSLVAKKDDLADQEAERRKQRCRHECVYTPVCE